MNKLVNGTLAAVGTASDLECLEMYTTDPDGALAIYIDAIQECFTE